MELQGQYSTDSQALSWALKVWFIALRRLQEHPKLPSIHINNYCLLSCCIKCQNSEMELQGQYSTDSQALSWSFKVWFIALRCCQERPKRWRNGYNNWIIGSTPLYSSISQNFDMKLHNNHWTHSQDESWSWKLLFTPLRFPKEYSKQARIYWENHSLMF